MKINADVVKNKTYVRSLKTTDVILITSQNE